ncbi:unknown [Clostridium sp. CAG:678]|jgi:hypothetical protein|nr:unknown [Clostridium sp. CAG:678]
MIKGFIEVTNIKTDRPNLINIDWIEEVYDDNIYIAFNPCGCIIQDYIQCRESYEEIKQKIKEAQ